MEAQSSLPGALNGMGVPYGQPAQGELVSWMDRVHKQDRIAVVEQMVAMFKEKNPNATEDKMYELCRRLEHLFWKSCTSEEMYRDPMALKKHIHNCSQRKMPVQQQQNVGQALPERAPVVTAQMLTPAQQQQLLLQQYQQQPHQQQQFIMSGGGMMPLKQEGGVAMMMHPGMVPIKQEGMAGAAAGGLAVGGIGGYPNGIGFPNGLINQATAVPGGVNPAAALQINGMVGAGGMGGNGLAVAGEPAGASTAESGPRQLTPDPMGFMSQAFMSNGAPVLVRGGNPASGSAPNAGMLAYPLMPQQQGVKVEGGGGGGMVPVGAMAPAQLMHHSGSAANMCAGNPPPLQALPDGISRDQSLDDFGSYVDFQVVAGAGGSDHETRKQQILKQQRWLLFLRHCAKCNLAETQCQYGHNCTVAKNLWQHLIACKDPSCTYARCVPSRELLKHHQNCTSERCPVCAPVKQYVSKQRQAVMQQKLESMPPEDRVRFQEHIRRRNEQMAARAANNQMNGGSARMPAPSDLAAPVVDPQASKRPRLMTQENMGTSLLEYFSVEQIQKHMQRLRLSGAGAPEMRRANNMLASLAEEESQCKVCFNTKLCFEPPSLYCYGCGSRIKRNQTYHASPPHPDFRGCWCHTCFTASGPTIQLDSLALRKTDLVKKKNDDVQEEGWVQCDSCESWVHQICGLFNKGRNNEDRGYICPECLQGGLIKGTRTVPAERPQAMLTAKDLPRCELSDFIEARLLKAVAEERAARAKALGCGIKDVPTCEGLCVRVVNNVEKLNEVKWQFAEAFAKNGVFPSVFEYKQKVVLMFQELEGVDMCLYCLYLQEYGDKVPAPNTRTVYLSYLDSVKYFQPEALEACGLSVALRTYIYHEILLAYIAYAKAHGFRSMYIWACPPMQGDDYIMYCHPGRQKTPRSDRLREWYLAMLRRSRSEGTVVYISNLFDSFFEGGRDHRREKPSATALPYFDGDYWPGEAENLLASLAAPAGGGTGNGMDNKPRKTGKDKRWRPTPGSGRGEQLLGRLGDAIQGMKEDFIVAHLYESCSHCTAYIDGGVRHYHPSPPQKVVIKSERTFDGIALDRPGGESSRTVSLNRFQLCQGCYDREAGCAADGARPLGLPSGIELSALIAEACPPIPPTDPDPVPRIDNEFFDTRHQFLSLCQGNHYQFDSLRRARHSSMMVLYHLHNPSEPAFSATCNVCQMEVKPGEGYRCPECSDFDMCPTCFHSPTVTHPHRLVKSVAGRRFDETRERLSEEDRVNRGKALHRTMQLLVHASGCSNPKCPSSNCAKVKALFSHAVSCNVKVTGGCMLCRRMWALLQAHAKICTSVDCPVPRCRELRQLRRQQAARQEDKRRAAYRQMLTQQAQQQEQEAQPG